jgi:hypothetical protein
MTEFDPRHSDGPDIYLRAAAADRHAASRWLKTPGALTAFAGVDDTVLYGTCPLSLITEIATAADIRRDQTTTIGGVPATGSSGTFSPAGIKSLSAKQRAAVGSQQLRELRGFTTQFHIWLGANGVLRKLVERTTFEGLTTTTSYTVLAINSPITVTIPRHAASLGNGPLITALTDAVPTGGSARH